MSSLWYAVDYNGNYLEHKNSNSKKLGTNPKSKKKVKKWSSDDEVQGPSLGWQDYENAYINALADEQLTKSKKVRKNAHKKREKIVNQWNTAIIADSKMNKKGVAKRNYTSKTLHPLSYTRTTMRQDKENDYPKGTHVYYKKGTQMVDQKTAKKAFDQIKKSKKKNR